MWGLLLLQSTGFRRSGFSRCNMQASVCGVQVLEHGLSSCCAQAELLHKGSWLFYRDRNDKKGSNKEFADGLVVRILSFHCCAWIDPSRGLEIPVSTVRQKKEKEPNKFFCLRLQWMKHNKMKNATDSISNSRRIRNVDDNWNYTARKQRRKNEWKNVKEPVWTMGYHSEKQPAYYWNPRRRREGGRDRDCALSNNTR